jgi:hypothetical protein
MALVGYTESRFNAQTVRATVPQGTFLSPFFITKANNSKGAIQVT